MIYKILKSLPNINQIYTSENGEKALIKINKYKDTIHLVLLDKNMPVMNGWKSAREMRNVTYEGLIIGLTGEDSTDDVDMFIQHGADMVIAKPLDARKIGLLQQFLTKYGATRPPNKKIQIVDGEWEWV
jgi:DNA-binding response OmpR family regulator